MPLGITTEGHEPSMSYRHRSSRCLDQTTLLTWIPGRMATIFKNIVDRPHKISISSQLDTLREKDWTSYYRTFHAVLRRTRTMPHGTVGGGRGHGAPLDRV